MSVIRVERSSPVLPNISVRKSFTLQSLLQLFLIHALILHARAFFLTSLLLGLVACSSSKNGCVLSVAMGVATKRACRLQERSSVYSTTWSKALATNQFSAGGGP